MAASFEATEAGTSPETRISLPPRQVSKFLLRSNY